MVDWPADNTESNAEETFTMLNPMTVSANTTMAVNAMSRCFEAE